MRFWPRWRSALLVVQPETVIRWHREGFRRYWRSISKPGRGRPPISEETRKLILQMATENPWRRKIQAELSKLGIVVSLATISRYLPKAKPGPGSQQRWLTFLRNHRDLIAGMGFFVVPTVRFHLLFVWFAIDHGRRRILHCNVTPNPVALWVIQQLRNPVVVLNEDHLRRLLRDYVAYYNTERVHTAIEDAPDGRAVHERPSKRAKVFGVPRVEALHHRYAWAEAA